MHKYSKFFKKINKILTLILSSILFWNCYRFITRHLLRGDKISLKHLEFWNLSNGSSNHLQIFLSHFCKQWWMWRVGVGEGSKHHVFPPPDWFCHSSRRFLGTQPYMTYRYVPILIYTFSINFSFPFEDTLYCF